MDMSEVDFGTSPDPLLRYGDDRTFRHTATGEGFHVATMAATSTSYGLGDGSLIRSGSEASPLEAAAFAEAALATSYCTIPPEDAHRGGREGHHEQQQQPQRHSVHGYPPSTSWSSDGGGSRSREIGDYEWCSRSHKESWGFGDTQEERVQTDQRDGSVGTRDHGVGIPAKREARMHALEQELIGRAQDSKRVRSSTTPAPPVTTHGMVFPPPSRHLSHLLEDNMIHRAPESISAKPDALAGVPMNSTTGAPATTAIRRRRRCPSFHEEEHKPFLPARHSDEWGNGLDGKGPFITSQEPPRRRARTAAGPKIQRTGKKNIANRCQHPTCSRGSTFGAKGGAKKPIYCATHKLDGMVRITSRQCAHQLCSTAPSYGFQGKRACFCSKHKIPGMVNVVTPRCQRDGCGRCASYGHVAERRPLFCARHAQAGMMNVVSRKCFGIGCTKNPSYGNPGDRRASFCVDHHLAGMLNIVSPKCLAPECRKAPSFGQRGDPKPGWCKTHKQEDMVNILYSRQPKKKWDGV
eukprot:g10429.t1